MSVKTSPVRVNTEGTEVSSDLQKLTQLGQATTYPSTYDASLLQPIPRRFGRALLGMSEGQGLAFSGIDLWTHYELSWLNAKGKPRVAIGEIRVPIESPNLIESKSLKLYFNSLNNVPFESAQDFVNQAQRDLSACAGAQVGLTLLAVNEPVTIAILPGQCLDDLDLTCTAYEPDATLLVCDEQDIVDETWHSHLLRSNCPVTNQPDWASIVIRYRGPRIQPESLLAYLVSFRQHADFHEHCVERIFCDLQTYAGCHGVSVYARYTRRGGLDINPFRSNMDTLPNSLRSLRQ